MGGDLEISLCEVVKSPLCVASDDGQKVYDQIVGALKTGRPVTLSCLHVTSLTLAFLHAAIGQLYSSFSEEQIQSLIKVEGIQQADRDLVKRVMGAAKQYYEDPRSFQQAVGEVLGEEDDDGE